MSKRGLSTIVATLIIILLVLVAVGIIWVVIRNVIQEGSEQISLGKFTLDLQIEQVQIGENQIEVKIKRNAGAGEFVAIKFVIDDGITTEVIEKNVSLKELEMKTFVLDLQSIRGPNIIKIQIAPVFRLESGKEIVGNVKDEYIVSSGTASGYTCTDTCLSKGYECGTYNICGTNINCGSCSGDLVCSGGGCVEDSTCTDTCSSLIIDCGTADICGTSTDCGSCSTGYSCQSGSCVQDCTDTCLSLSYECGTQTVCGSSIDCGSCSGDLVCSGGGCVEDSTCTDTCSILGIDCGTADVCGTSTDCGSCSTGYSCQSGSCVQDCTDTCLSLGHECGAQTVCGTSTNCGSCSTGYSCQSGSCVQDCTDTCLSLGHECGAQTVCGTSTDCGSCSTGYSCSAGTCVQVSQSWETGLISWWKFDTDATDSVGNNHGTVTGATLNPSGGISGGAYVFDGSGDYIGLGSDSSLNTGDYVTISIWLNPSAWSAEFPTIYNRGAQSRSIGFNWIYTIGYSAFFYQYADGVEPRARASHPVDLTFGNWHNLVIVHDDVAKTVIFYGNGVVIRVTDYVGDAADVTSGTAWLGTIQGSDSPNYGWNGAMDEVMIWDRALSPTEISQLYNYF